MAHDPDHRFPDTPTVSDCGYDWLDTFAIEQIRWLCVSYGQGTCRGWETAVERCEAVLGETIGPAFFSAVSAVMVAIRRGRKSPFEYVDPSCRMCCTHVLAPERAIMNVIRAARRDDETAMLSHGFLLLEGRDPAALGAAARRLAAVMARADQEQRMLNETWRRPEPRPLHF